MIQDVKVEKNSDGTIKRVRVVFGLHHFVNIDSDGNKTAFTMGATHHGFQADASVVNSELEQLCEEVRRSHPELCID
jgi:hypothetical protein